jgi:hypothetical protein
MVLLVLIKIKVKFFPSNSDKRSSKKALAIALRDLSKIDKKGSKESPTIIIERYLTSKIGEGVGSLTRDELKRRMVKAGVSKESSEELSKYLELVEMSRYTGETSHGLAINGITVIKKIDKEIR